MNLALTIASWMVIALCMTVTVVALFDIRAARKLFFGPMMIGPDYLDSWYATEWYHKIAFVLAVLWLIFG